MKHRFVHLTFISLLILSTTGCIIHIGGHSDKHQSGDISSLLGDIEISDDQKVENISVVNGDIILGDGVTTEKIDTVNGSIKIGKYAQIYSAASVNGHIGASIKLSTVSDVSSVNGSIELAAETLIGGNVVTVNGSIILDEVEVKGTIETTNGDINLENATITHGDVIFHAKGDKQWSNNNLPTLTIDKDSQIDGKIILHREVILDLKNKDLLKQVERRYLN